MEEFLEEDILFDIQGVPAIEIMETLSTIAAGCFVIYFGIQQLAYELAQFRRLNSQQRNS